MNELEQKIYNSPQDEVNWNTYISFLEKDFPRKAKILKLDRSESTNANLLRKSELIKEEPDKLWVAQFETFKGYVKEFKEVELTLGFYGKAPKRYGNRAIKLSREQLLFLLRIGWEFVGKGTSYYYGNPPKNYKGTTSKLNVKLFVPKKTEIKNLMSHFDLTNNNPNVTQIRYFSFWESNYSAGGWTQFNGSHVLFISKKGMEVQEPEEPEDYYHERQFSLSFSSLSMSFKWSENNKESYNEFITEY